MRTLLVTSVLLASLLPAPRAFAAPLGSSGGGSFAAQQQARQEMLNRNATWRQRLMERLRQTWSRPALSKPYQAPKPIATAHNPLTPRSGVGVNTERTTSLTKNPTAHVGAERRTPWTLTGGFGRLVRRAVAQIRFSFEPGRIAGPGTLIARIRARMGGQLVRKSRAPAIGVATDGPRPQIDHSRSSSSPERRFKPARYSKPRFRVAAPPSVRPRFRLMKTP